VLTFWKPGKSIQSTLCSETLDQGWWTKITQ
jgi:hypothetical protein